MFPPHPLTLKYGQSAIEIRYGIAAYPKTDSDQPNDHEHSLEDVHIYDTFNTTLQVDQRNVCFVEML